MNKFTLKVRVGDFEPEYYPNMHFLTSTKSASKEPFI